MSCAGCQLDVQQIEAVVACEDAQLVLASAGSGKTLSLLGKVEYLNHELKIPAEQIMVISFTQKTVAELKERCSVKGVEIRTFHSLGNSILQYAKDSTLGSRKLIGDADLAHFVRHFCEYLIAHDHNFARDFVDFILFFNSAPASPAKAQNHASRVSFNRLYLRHALKQKPDEHIRVKDEQLIANWLYLYDLPFCYQQNYPDSDYKPTFTLQLPRPIYLDYFVVNRKGKSMYGPQYVRDIKWRAELHTEKHTSYTALESWRWDDYSLFDYLKSELIKHQIIPQRRNDAEVYIELSQNQDYQKEVDNFYQMLQTFLSLHKNAMYDFAEITERLSSADEYTKRRNQTFLRIYQRVYDAYERYLYKTRQYDFADMINSAKQCVEEISECACGYKYILLDEVQDLSRNRFLLVKAILRKNPGCKLFAVGDDWQSIYRFTGSDLTLIQEFEQTFGLETRRSFIETTHRFGQPTIRISCDFIQHNPAQSHKLVRNISKAKTPIFVILNKPAKLQYGHDADSLTLILQELITKETYAKIQQKSLQVISRYNHDIARLEAPDYMIAARKDAPDIYDIA